MSFPGSAQLFTAQKRGGLGIRSASRKNAHEEGLVPSERAMEVFNDISHTADPLAKAKEGLSRGYTLENSYEWLWYLQLNYNILLYGFGSKSKLLTAMCNESLSGEDVLSIDGTSSSHGLRIIKALLDTICTKILRLPVETTTAFCSIQVYSTFIQDCLNSHYGRVNQMSSQQPSIVAPRENQPSLKLNHLPPTSTASDEDRVQYQEVESAFEVTENASIDSVVKSSSDDNIFTKAYLNTNKDDATLEDAESYGGILGKRKASNILYLGQAFGSTGGRVGCPSLVPDEAWGKRYAHAKARLYILVHNIDGCGLESVQAQQLLSCLAACSSVSVIASADKLNFQLLWDSSMLAQYRWMYVHCPTFDSYPVDAKLTIKLGAGGQNKRLFMDSQAYEYIIKSLNTKYKEVLGLLSELTFQQRRDQLVRNQSVTSKRTATEDTKSKAKSGPYSRRPYTPSSALCVPGSSGDGVPFDLLFESCRSRMIVLGPADLRQLLKDLVGHRLVALLDDDRRKIEVVCILMPDVAIKDLLGVSIT